jgi:disulfide bond formation protein DsbB
MVCSMHASAFPPAWVIQRWPYLAIAASAAMLAAAHAFETFGDMAPCALCLRQREVYWGAMLIGAAGLVTLRMWPRPGLRRTLGVFLGLAFLTGAIVAGYHVAVEAGWVVARCEGFALPSNFQVLGSSNAQIEAPKCDQPAWVLFGVSMAGYNMLVSIALAALSFVCGLRARVDIEPASEHRIA